MLQQKSSTGKNTPLTSRKVTGQQVPVKKPSAKGNRSVAKPLSVQAVSTEARHALIADVAYYIAEQHGFQGDALDDWLQAEAIIDARLAARAATQTSDAQQ